MNKRQIRLAIASICTIVLLYLIGVGFYANRFTPRSQFASIQIGGLTMPQAADKITTQLPTKTIKLYENNRSVGQLSLESVSVDGDIEDPLSHYYSSLNPDVWVWRLIVGSKANWSPISVLNFSDEELEDQLLALGINNEEREPTLSPELIYDQATGYTLSQGQAGNRVDPTRLKNQIGQALATGKLRIDLEDTYQQLLTVDNNPELEEWLSYLNQLVNNSITYEIADKEIQISSEQIHDWLYFDEFNQVVFDSEAINQYLIELNEEYNTFDKPRTFMSTNQGQVTVEPGTLGWSIDLDQELNQLVQDLQSGEPVKREPVIHTTGGQANQSDDIGDTYIEVDLTYQAMYLYKKGQLVYETPIVSGQSGAETIPGANVVLSMARDINLQGYNQISNVSYSTPVSYWISFDHYEQGMHDATWQGQFGGDQYYYNGSLGCINTPLEMAQLFFEEAYVGMPFILFY